MLPLLYTFDLILNDMASRQVHSLREQRKFFKKTITTKMSTDHFGMSSCVIPPSFPSVMMIGLVVSMSGDPHPCSVREAA